MSTDRLLTIGSIVLTVVLAVPGWYLAWYFYRAALPTRIPTFLISVPAVLVGGSSSATSDITILYKNHPIRQKAVNVVRVYFWNAGNTPIIEAAKDIWKPFTITISGDSEILDVTVLKVSRDLTFITCDAQEDKRNKAIVNFDRLESNDGAALQITYAGPNDAKLEFDGVTIGAPSPTVIVMTDYSQYSQKISNSLL